MAVVGAIVGGVVLFGGDDGGGVTDDGKEYKLTAPERVLGDYESAYSDAGTEKKLTAEQAAAFGVDKGGSGLNAVWETSGEAKRLQLIGAYGEVTDPEKSVDAYFADLERRSRTAGSGDSDVELVGTPERKTPDGLDNAIMKCQTIRTTEETNAEEPTSIALCVWGDYGTVGAVVPTEGNKALTLDESAAIATDLREEVRVEVT
ncbi:hypothetical protein [Streptomyces sp. S465]|uniref:hypothetical protein n=1 Tax=Streptomyces sp. S465 TaxID=2979468 RepID=UPI0022A87EFF|nr:hypothetical protein [Streptomyces sp. S465]WAP55625.1 hypothetical protein N6H00_11860 [Streptomyces sp. S465]